MNTALVDVVFTLALCVAAAAIWNVVRSLIDRFCRSERRNDVFVYVLAVPCTVAVGIPLYYAAQQWFQGITLSRADLRVSFSCVVAFLLMAYSMYRLKSPQYGRPFLVTVGTNKYGPRCIPVRRLNTRGPASEDVCWTLTMCPVLLKW